LIHQVFKGSPAEEAGIKKNDILVKINGNDAMEIGLIEVEDMLKKIGDTVELVVKSGSTEKTVSIQLEEII